MRKFLYAVFCFFAVSKLEGASSSTPSYLNETETQTLIQMIDGICADTWCSGDLDYRFDQLVCHDKACYLDIQAITRNGNAASQSRPYRCELTGFHTASDLLRKDSSFDGTTRYRYTDKLYEAVTSCLNEDVPQRYPLAFVPAASACRESLRRQPRFQSASHSGNAEVFYEIDNKAQASAQVLNQMVEQYAAQDSQCSLQYLAVFEDEINCERTHGANTICQLPTDLGRFIVIKDSVDGAAILYLENTAKSASLGELQADTVDVGLAQPCYPELLNLDGKQSAQTPYDSVDHRSYYVSAKGLDLKQDARSNAAALVNRVMTRLARTSDSCTLQKADVSLGKASCRTLSGVPSCVLPASESGYYVVTKDSANGAFVTFVRFD